MCIIPFTVKLQVDSVCPKSFDNLTQICPASSIKASLIFSFAVLEVTSISKSFGSSRSSPLLNHSADTDLVEKKSTSNDTDFPSITVWFFNSLFI